MKNQGTERASVVTIFAAAIAAGLLFYFGFVTGSLSAALDVVTLGI